MQIYKNQKTIYFLSIYGRTEEDIITTFKMYIEDGETWMDYELHDQCECCGQYYMHIQYDSKKTLLAAYNELMKKPKLRGVEITYEIDRTTIRNYNKDINEHLNHKN